ncbi:hypothetical protein CCHR01_12699 [Colletotrichum chrysophilum]|uniref:Uncharacterized protein n=1 Tax=Colletotrichum chrysophilum TaxID=1836956 RepID=A0AAD9AAS4_9PEZI|nr:hypothetical protein CCHR01_12699 [Colletotrichum chrysophilum]
MMAGRLHKQSSKSRFREEEAAFPHLLRTHRSTPM